MKLFRKFVLFFLITIVGIFAFLFFMQEKLIFFPVTLSKEYKFEFSEPFDEIFLTTEDGASLNAIHFKSESPKGVILYFHGNADNLVRWGNISEGFVHYGYDIIVMDYRGFGKSSGEFNEEAMYADAQLFYDYAAKHYAEKDVTVFGRSLGTTFATYVASKNNPKNLILETPFYSLLDVAKRRMPMLPMDLLLKYKFPTNKYMGGVDCPVTIFHGTKDRIVPLNSSEKLFGLIPNGNGTFLTIKGGGHRNLIEFTEYNKTIQRILE